MASEPDATAASGDGDLIGGAVADRAAYRALFRNADYRNLFFAMLTSSLGDWIGVLAILALTESILGQGTRAAAFALSGVMIARVLPTLLLGPVAGVYVDRWDRKRLMIVTDIGRGIIMALIPFVGRGEGTATGVTELFVATFAIEVMSTLFGPAKDATVPNIVRRERLVHANQLSLIVTYGTLPLGGVLFALLVGTSNTFFTGVEFLQMRPSALAIWFNAATFFVSAVLVALIRDPDGDRRRTVSASVDQPGWWAELTEGIRFISAHPLIRALIVGVTAAFLGAGIVLAVGKLFTTIVNAGESGFGVLVAAVGSGLFAGLLGSAPLAQRLGKERLFAPGIGVAGGGLIVAALMPRLDLATIPAFIMGLGAGVGFLTGYTMLQEYASDEIRGRTFAAFNTAIRAALFISLVVGPLMVGIIGLEQPEVVTATETAGEAEQEPGGATGAIGAETGGFGIDLESEIQQGVYGYSIGGVRITLILAGIIALAGAVWTGRSIHRVLSTRLDLVEATESRRRVGTGVFVALEGGEGAGKSTQLRLLRAAVERAGFDVLTTREPGGTQLGEEIRNLLLDPSMEDMSPRAEALLYAAARAQHVQEVIQPALDKGMCVVTDRFIDSSVIYQGTGRDLGEQQIEELNRWGVADLLPDLIVLLDVAPELGLERAGGEPDRLEQAGMDFHRRVNEAFRRRAASHPGRYLVIDATLPAEEIHARIRDSVIDKLSQRQGTIIEPPVADDDLGPDGE